MKIVLYGENNYILGVFENVSLPKVKSNSVEWESGSIVDTTFFVVLDDEIDLTNGLTDEIMTMDKKNEFIVPVPVDETAELKAKLEIVQGAVDFIIMNY